jgi:hypothetical protein
MTGPIRILIADDDATLLTECLRALLADEGDLSVDSVRDFTRQSRLISPL